MSEEVNKLIEFLKHSDRLKDRKERLIAIENETN